MGKHRNRRKNGSSVLGLNRDLYQENQILHSAVKDLEPWVGEALQKIPGATEAQKLEMALLLQKVARGQASLLERPEASDLVSRMRARAREIDAVSEKYEKDKAGFIEEVFDQAEKIKLTGDKAERAKAETSKKLQSLTTSARGRMLTDRKRFEQIINQQPKRQITVLGHLEMVRVGENVQPQITPEVIRLKHLVWVLHPGTHIVPESVAAVFEERQKSAAETAARAKALQAGPGEAGRDVNVFEEWNRINRQYGSSSELPKTYGIL